MNSQPRRARRPLRKSLIPGSDIVKAWQETVILPTYPPPPADPNPMFLEKRINQGTSGRVYPNPFTDHVANDPERKVDRPYQAVFLENEYLQLMILPEIGGRLHAGLDKTNGYNFIYRQHVVKPALIGLFGAWISGGVEWNWPMHHRPSTFMPVDHFIEAHPDGGRTVWLSEHDPMWRMKGMVGLCLHPGKAFLEAKVRLYNRTPLTQRFLWWANVAVPVNEDYQFFFPPDVSHVTFHARADMCHFPIAREEFCGLDFTSGVDISRWRNVPAPTSFFVMETQFDHFGGYDHGRQAGLVHVADRHIAPGKKMFTWGNGEFGKAWERNLTDEDGPYIELMAGAYTDNQPDFSWLQPYETKVFSQYWYPIQQIGPAKNANLRAALNLEVTGATARIGVCVTETFAGARVSLSGPGGLLCETQADLAPGAPWVGQLDLPAETEETALLLRVCTASGKELIRYAPQEWPEQALPPDFTPLPPPEQLPTNEALYLNGLHLEQYLHPTWSPEPYWQEALRRDPQDSRCLTVLGMAQLKRGQFAAAEGYLRRAVASLTRLNPNPLDGAPYYFLGLALGYQGKDEQAGAAHAKATWSSAWQAAGYTALAELDCRRADWQAALERLERALELNMRNLKARALRAAALRRLGHLAEAAAACQQTLALDPLDHRSRYELLLAEAGLVPPNPGPGAGERLAKPEGDAAEMGLHADELLSLTRGDPQTFLDLTFDYANAGLFFEAVNLLRLLLDRSDLPASRHPLLWYALGFGLAGLGQGDRAAECYRTAASLPPAYCFPSRLEELLALQAALQANPEDARACYYLGNLLYDKDRPGEAIDLWRRAARLEPGFATPWRNLGIAAYNVLKDPRQALECYRAALAADPSDGRLFFELDQLHKLLGRAPAERLAFLESRPDLVTARHDLTLERAALLNRLGQPQAALEVLLARRFFPWEGGEGAVSGQYETAHLLLGRAALKAGQPADALAHFQSASDFPESLGEVRWWSASDAHLQFFCGLAQQALGDHAGARASFEAAAAHRGELSPLTYYQALALRQLGKEDQASRLLQRLLDHAAARLQEQPGYGYFYTSLANLSLFQDDLPRLQRVHYTYLSGLARLGLGQTAAARQDFEAVLALDPAHQGACMGLEECVV